MSKEERYSEEIIDLIAKKLSGNLSDDEQKQFESWLAESEANRSYVAEYSNIWKASQQPLEVNTDAAWNKVKSRIKTDIPIVQISKKATPFYRIAVAASVILLMTVSAFYYFNSGTTYEASNEQIAVLLEDGSDINLNSNSSLKVVSDFNENERRVALDGEAYFDIAKDKSKPFIIETDLVNVMVLGTSFNVNECADSVVVTVTSGIVEVSDISSETNKRKLLKGERLVFRNNKKSFRNLAFDENDFAWKTRTLVFRRTYLENAFKVIESTYGVDVQLENAAINNCKLTAQFEDQTLEEVLEVIQSTFGLTVKQTEKTITISGEGCN